MALSKFDESQNMIKWSLKRLIDIQIRIFAITGSNCWHYGSDSTMDLVSAVFEGGSPFPTGPSWQNPTPVTIYRYTSSTGLTWVVYEDLPTTPWIGRVHEVKLLNQDEVLWEAVLDIMPNLRESTVVQQLDSNQESFQAFYSSLVSPVAPWETMIPSMLTLWNERTAQNRADLARLILRLYTYLSAQTDGNELPLSSPVNERILLETFFSLDHSFVFGES
ncbi:hypothetical protein F5884DRAFT_380984 [Xylogone sp. PMI_703]|nr:hypothetical protein F5884DRAFT_380984 [Xylogone sp. PMI_703]